MFWYIKRIVAANSLTVCNKSKASGHNKVTEMTEESSDFYKALVVKDEDGVEYFLLKVPDDKSK